MTTLKLRPYQQAAIDAVRENWRVGKNRVVLVAPVGAGKTACAEGMIQRALESPNGFDVWFLAHRAELIDQPARRFMKSGIPFGIVKAGVAPKPGCRVQIASVQTLKNRPIEALSKVNKRALVFVDEGHRVKANTYLQILRDLRTTYEVVYVVYLTATPYRLDGQGLGDVADALVEATTPKELISLGFITEGTVIGRPPPEQLDPRAVGADGEYDEAATEAIMDRPKLVGDAVATWKKHSDGYPGLGRCCTKASAMRRAEAFKAAGFRVGFLDGETPRRERQSLLARLAIGGQRSASPLGLDVLLFVNVLTEGYDSESSYDLVLHECRSELWQGRSYPPEYVPLCVLGDYAPTKSMGAFIQFWGRGSRVHKDKPWLRLLSHAGNEDEHCFLSAHEGFSLEHKQSEWMAKLRERNIQQGVAVSQGGATRLICATCQTRWLPGTTTCLHCGGNTLNAMGRAPGEDGGGDEEAPGELVEKQADAEAPRPPTPFELEAWFTSEFSKLRRENSIRVSDGQRAWKPGRIIFKYKGIFKRDPPWEVYNRYKRQYGFTQTEE